MNLQSIMKQVAEVVGEDMPEDISKAVENTQSQPLKTDDVIAEHQHTVDAREC